LIEELSSARTPVEDAVQIPSAPKSLDSTKGMLTVVESDWCVQSHVRTALVVHRSPSFTTSQPMATRHVQLPFAGTPPLSRIHSIVENMNRANAIMVSCKKGRRLEDQLASADRSGKRQRVTVERICQALESCTLGAAAEAPERKECTTLTIWESPPSPSHVASRRLVRWNARNAQRQRLKDSRHARSTTCSAAALDVQTLESMLMRTRML